MTPLVRAIDAALVHFLWQGALVAVLLWLTLAALRNRSANVRYLASCGAMLLLAALPAITAWLSYERALPLEDAPGGIAVMTVTVIPVRASLDWLALLQRWMLPVWACGVLMLSIRMLWGCALVSALKRTGRAAEPWAIELVERLARRVGVTRQVRILISTIADGPSVAGWVRPVLLLPAATLLGLSAEQLGAVIAHELAHIRRYDYLVNLLQMLIETVLFYHPAVWWISNRIREERELCCDDVAVSVCGDAAGYARALAALERMRAVAPGLAASTALAAKGGSLLYRIERLLGTERHEQAPSRLPGIVAICVGLACVAMNIQPAKAQVPLPPTPLPPVAPLPPATPLVVVQAPRVATSPSPTVVVQVKQAPAETEPARPVTVEVTVDSDGSVVDARVIDGPLEQRRSALLAALNMRFVKGAPSTRELKVLANDPSVRRVSLAEILDRFKTPPNPELRRTTARERIANANARIALLRAQQAGASETGAAQLQEAIDRNLKIIADMERFVAGQDPLVGATLDEIRVSGMNVTEQARAQVIAQLPIHVNDILSDASMAAAVQAVRNSYPRASAYFGEIPDTGHAVFIVTLPLP